MERRGNPHKIPTLTHWDPNKDRDGEPKERERFWRDKSEEIKRFIQEHQKVGNRVTCVEIAWMLMEKYKRPISTRSVMNVLVDYRIADPEFPFLYHLNKNRKTPRREGNYGFWAEHKDEILELVAANPERNYADLAGIMEAKFGRSISADALGTVLGRWRRGIRLTRLKRPKVGTARTKRIRKKRTRNDSKEVAEGRKSIVLSQREAVRACLDDIAELMNRPEGCRRGDIIELVRAKTGVSVTRKNMGVVLAVIRTEQRMAGKPVLPKIKLHDSTGQTNGGDIRPEIEIQKPRTQPIDVITVDIDPNAGITGNKAGIIAFVGIVTRIWGGCSTHDIVRMLGRYGINTTPKSIGNRISLWRRTDPNIPSLKDRRRAQKVAAIPAETVTHQKTELSKEHKDEKYQQIKEIVWIGGKTGNSLLEISLRLAQSQEVVLTADEIVALMKEVGVFEEWLEQIRKRETSLMHGFAIRGLDGRAEIEKLGGHIAQHDDKVEWIPKNDDNPKLGRADQTDQENVATTEQSKKHGFWRRIRENIRTFIEERHGKGERCSNQEIADWIYRNHSRKVSRHSVENALSSYRKDDKTFPNLHCMKNNAPYVKIAKSDKKDEIPERDTRSDGQRTMREAKERVLDLLNKADAEGKYPTHTDIVEVLRSEGVRIASVGAFNEMLTRWRKEGGDDAKERIPKRMHGMGVRRKNT